MSSVEKAFGAVRWSWSTHQLVKPEIIMWPHSIYLIFDWGGHQSLVWIWRLVQHAWTCWSTGCYKKTNQEEYLNNLVWFCHCPSVITELAWLNDWYHFIGCLMATFTRNALFGLNCLVWEYNWCAQVRPCLQVICRTHLHRPPHSKEKARIHFHLISHTHAQFHTHLGNVRASVNPVNDLLSWQAECC